MYRTKRLFIVLFTALFMTVLILPSASAAAYPSNWTDEGVRADTTPETGSFTIESEAELALLANTVNGGNSYQGCTITLGKNLDLSGHNWIPIGTSSKPFKGTFDGNGHTISGMSVNALSSGTLPVGFFGMVLGGTVKNINVSGEININFSGATVFAGGIAGVSDNGGQIINCSFTGDINSASTSMTAIGGIVGSAGGGQIHSDVMNCFYTGSLASGGTSYLYIGGIVGNCNSPGIANVPRSKIENCYSAVTAVSAKIDSKTFVGGIGGNIISSADFPVLMTSCYWENTIVSGSGNPVENGYSACGWFSDFTTPVTSTAGHTLIAEGPLLTLLNTWVGARSGSGYTVWSLGGAGYPVLGEAAPAEKEAITITYGPQTYLYDGSGKAFHVTTLNPETGLSDFIVEYSIPGGWTQTAPTGAGTYAVKVSRAEDDLYAAFERTITGGLVIGKAPGTLIISCDSFTYGAPGPFPSPTANSSGGAISYRYKSQGAADETYSDTPPSAVGSYTVRASSAATENYEAAAATANFAINQAEMTGISAADYAGIYDGSAHGIAVTCPEDASIEYSADNSSWVSAKPLYTDAGSYLVYYRVTKANYMPFYSVAQVRISPYSAPVVWTGDESFPYTGNNQGSSVAAHLVGVGSQGHIDLSLAFEKDSAEADFTNAGTYTVTAAVASANGNYSLTNKTKEYSITRAGYPAAISWPGDFAFTYGSALGSQSLDDGFSWTPGASYRPKVRETTASMTFTPSNPNYLPAVNSNIAITVAPKTLTVVGASAADRVYDGTKNVQVSAIGISGKESDDEVYLTSTTVTGNADDSAVGTQGVSAAFALSGLDAENYVLTRPGALYIIISPLTVELSWSASAFVYDGTAKTVTAAVTNAVAGEIVHVTDYLCAAGTDADNYLASATALSDSNYTLNSCLAQAYAWAITRAVPETELFTYDLSTKTVGGAPLGVAVTKKSGVIGLGSFTVNYDGSESAPSEAGTYAVSVHISAGQNYSAAVLQLGSFILEEKADESSGGPGGDAGGGTTGGVVGGGSGGGSDPSDGEVTIDSDEQIPLHSLSGFTDLDDERWSYEAISYVIENGLMNGVSSERFNPRSGATRAMLIAALWRLSGSPEASDDALSGFVDIPENAWYKNAASWAVGLGIAGGYGGAAFAPEDCVTREQIAVLLCRYAKKMGFDTSETASLSAFSDSSETSGWAFDALGWAVHSGLMTGRGDRLLAPGATAAREEIAEILMRFCKLLAARETQP